MKIHTAYFFGVPLSQLYNYDYDYGNSEDGRDHHFKLMLQGLTEVGDINKVLSLNFKNHFDCYFATEEDKKLFLVFINWLRENQRVLNLLGFKFRSHDNNEDEDAKIFGYYYDFLLDELGCSKVNMNNFIKITEKDKKIKELFSNMPKELISRFPPFAKAGLWTINHSK